MSQLREMQRRSRRSRGRDREVWVWGIQQDGPNENILEEEGEERRREEEEEGLGEIYVEGGERDDESDDRDRHREEENEVDYEVLVENFLSFLKKKLTNKTIVINQDAKMYDYTIN
eukprot:TRINITY_DN9708_c0_g1_i1.p1 TRINITY_DN9708_c0_g1~~TRINITY_DN9708_c0_g1_i1.p1  ORF type:complete len:116 (-),score=40.28 TRINITY_DN9708_c0_g1_i1:8-355(-)